MPSYASVGAIAEALRLEEEAKSAAVVHSISELPQTSSSQIDASMIYKDTKQSCGLEKTQSLNIDSLGHTAAQALAPVKGVDCAALCNAVKNSDKAVASTSSNVVVSSAHDLIASTCNTNGHTLAGEGSVETDAPNLATNEQPRCQFARLPKEVHRMILEHVVAGNKCIHVRTTRNIRDDSTCGGWKPPAVTAVSNQIRFVAWEVYFHSTNEFVIHEEQPGDTLSFLSNFESWFYDMMGQHACRITLVMNCYPDSCYLQRIETSNMDRVLSADIVIKRYLTLIRLKPILKFQDLRPFFMPSHMRRLFCKIFYYKLHGNISIDESGQEVTLEQWTFKYFHKDNRYYAKLRDKALENHFQSVPATREELEAQEREDEEAELTDDEAELEVRNAAMARFLKAIQPRSA